MLAYTTFGVIVFARFSDRFGNYDTVKHTLFIDNSRFLFSKNLFQRKIFLDCVCFVYLCKDVCFSVCDVEWRRHSRHIQRIRPILSLEMVIFDNHFLILFSILFSKIYFTQIFSQGSLVSTSTHSSQYSSRSC